MTVWVPQVEDVYTACLGWNCTSPLETVGAQLVEDPPGLVATVWGVDGGFGQEGIFTSSSCLPLVPFLDQEDLSDGYLTP